MSPKRNDLFWNAVRDTFLIERTQMDLYFTKLMNDPQPLVCKLRALYWWALVAFHHINGDEKPVGFLAKCAQDYMSQELMRETALNPGSSQLAVAESIDRIIDFEGEMVVQATMEIEADIHARLGIEVDLEEDVSEETAAEILRQYVFLCVGECYQNEDVAATEDAIKRLIAGPEVPEPVTFVGNGFKKLPAGFDLEGFCKRFTVLLREAGIDDLNALLANDPEKFAKLVKQAVGNG